MEKFVKLQSVYIPLPLNNVDTDMIIPAQFLTSISREGYGENAFRRLRDEDPEFPLSKPQYKGAQVLVVGENFGCGSSREHAVWALTGAGFRAIIGKSFADIFRSNSGKNGLLLVELRDELVDQLLSENSGKRVTIDLEKQIVTLPNGEDASFQYDPFQKYCLLEGVDDLDYIRKHSKEIEAFREKQDEVRFYKTGSPNR